MTKIYRYIVYTTITLVCISLLFWKVTCYRKTSVSADGAVEIKSFVDSRDRQFILDMFQKYWYWLVENPNFSPEFMMDHLSPDKKPENFGKEIIKVLYVNGEPAGFTTYNKQTFYKGYYHFLLVDEKFRGHRYADKIVRYALDDLFNQGVEKVWLAVRDNNKAAKNVYNRIGFKEVTKIDGFEKLEITKEDYESKKKADDMNISSNAFKNNGEIPKKYSCDGEDISPELSWSGAPSGTKSFALLVDDPDAPSGTFVHWILYNIPANINKLEENSDKYENGRNDFGKNKYGGPCPPKGDAHHYYFKIYALDIEKLENLDKNNFESSIQGHVLDKAELVGVYKRAE